MKTARQDPKNLGKGREGGVGKGKGETSKTGIWSNGRAIHSIMVNLVEIQ